MVNKFDDLPDVLRVEDIRRFSKDWKAASL